MHKKEAKCIRELHDSNRFSHSSRCGIIQMGGNCLMHFHVCDYRQRKRQTSDTLYVSSPQHKKHVQFEAYGIVMRYWNTFFFFSEHKFGWAFWFSQNKKRCRISFSGEMRHLSHCHINAVLIVPSSDDRYRCRCRRTSERQCDGPQGRNKQRRKMQGHRCREG